MTIVVDKLENSVLRFRNEDRRSVIFSNLSGGTRAISPDNVLPLCEGEIFKRRRGHQDAVDKDTESKSKHGINGEAVSRNHGSKRISNREN